MVGGRTGRMYRCFERVEIWGGGGGCPGTSRKEVTLPRGDGSVVRPHSTDWPKLVPHEEQRAQALIKSTRTPGPGDTPRIRREREY